MTNCRCPASMSLWIALSNSGAVCASRNPSSASTVNSPTDERAMENGFAIASDRSRCLARTSLDEAALACAREKRGLHFVIERDALRFIVELAQLIATFRVPAVARLVIEGRRAGEILAERA